MARAAFVMDGIMRKFALQGRSFVPLVLGFGCTVPAIMATRVIESDRDRKVTIMVLPLMSCGARLPIYALIIPAFFSIKYQATVMWIIYLIGVLIALAGARLLKSTLFKGDGEVYLMELPPYRMPTLKSLMLHMWDRGRMYLQKAATIILATSILLYICNTFPRKQEFSQDYKTQITALEKQRMLEKTQIEVLENAKLFNAEQTAELRKEKFLSPELLEHAFSGGKVSPAAEKILMRAGEYNDRIASLKNARQAELMEYTVSVA
jgi:ferrous iron transport protein B